MADLAKQIRARLEAARKEVSELEIALSVIERLTGTGNSAPATGKEPVANQGPLFTVRRAQPALEAPKKKRQSTAEGKAGGKSGVDWKNTVVNVLKDKGPMASGPIAELLGVTEQKREKQAVYNALSALKVDGFLDRDEEGTYSIIKPWVSAKAPAQAEPQADNSGEGEESAAAA